MTEPQFIQPPQTAQGLSSLVGALVYIQVLRHDLNMPSSFGTGREGITANVYVVDFPADRAREGQVLSELPILNVGVVNSLREAVGQGVLGRLYEKATRAGQNPAVILGEYTQADVELFKRYWAAKQGMNAPQAQRPQQQTPPASSGSALPPPPPMFGQTADPNTPPF